MDHPRLARTFVEQAAKRRSHLEENLFLARRRLRPVEGGERLQRLSGDVFLGPRHRLDVTVVAFPRRFPEREQPVVDEQETFHVRVLLDHLGRRFGQLESGHDIGHPGHFVAVDFLADRLHLGLVGEHQDGIGVGMVDELVRQKGVQQGFDRGVGRRCVEQVDALLVDHRLVAQRVEGAEFEERLQLHPGQPLRFQGIEVPAAALDVKHLDLLAHHRFGEGLDRRVAAPVKHQGGVAADQPGGVHAEGEVFPVIPVGIDGRLGVGIFPSILHSGSNRPLKIEGLGEIVRAII